MGLMGLWSPLTRPHNFGGYRPQAEGDNNSTFYIFKKGGVLMEQIKTVSIVIPCRNEEKYIGDCINSFLNQSYPQEDMEILICDGLSTDNTRSIVSEYAQKYPNVRLLDNPGLSAPKGMNIGINESKADAIIIFGAHGYAHQDFVKNNLLELCDPVIGCVGGVLETINENDKGKAIALAMSSPFGVGNALFRYAKERKFVDTVAFGAYRREVLDKIGYFDEELVRNQDDELNFRIIEAGYKILLSPEIKAYYYSRGSFGKLWKQYFQYGFWKVRVMQKHGKTASIRHLVPLAFVLINIFGILLGIFFTPILLLWILQLILYCFGDILFSVKLTKSEFGLLRYIPFIFPILHISYGLGFLQGIFAFYLFGGKKAIDKNTTMSR
jgi:cellulose synthase/poly-beta-1,6-N-acetylglucosamine synthase-like glycosyltransferase